MAGPVPLPSHWICGTDLTVSDEIQLPPDPSQGLWGRWLRRLRQNPDRRRTVVGLWGGEEAVKELPQHERHPEEQA